MREKTRRLKVGYRNVTRKKKDVYGLTEYIPVPSITLSGKWVEQMGFEIGDAVQVECEEGRLIITKREEE